MIHLEHITWTSPIGRLTIFSDADAVVAIECQPSVRGKGRAAARPRRGSSGCSTVLLEARRQLEEYFAGARTTFDLALAPRGTDFELAVWRALRALPFGATCSYGDLARRVGKATAFRAVGNANRKNPIPIVVPCHRVVGANGTLTGFALGLETKRWLLEHEGVVVGG